MRIEMSIGTNHVTIATNYDENEDSKTWGEVLDELVWPTLRAFGYQIDTEFTDGIMDEHQQYLSDKLKNRNR